MKRCFPIVILVFLLPASTFAEEAITRTEAIPLLWTPINRPAVETNEAPFIDVPNTHPHFSLITFLKARGIVEDGTYFRPDDPVRVKDALLWLLRSRNVAEWKALQPHTAPGHARRYGLLQTLSGTRDRRELREYLRENPPLTQEQMELLVQTLDDTLAQETHAVSYYGLYFSGRRTAFGEIFDPGALTAAHRTLPKNTLVKVMNTENNNSVVVRINDRGPYVHGRDMDLSRAAFEHLAPISRGVLHGIRFERLGSSDVVEQKQAVQTSWYQRHADRRNARRARRR